MRATSGPSKQNLIVEVIIKLLGLDVCADTGGWVMRSTRVSFLWAPSRWVWTCADTGAPA